MADDHYVAQTYLKHFADSSGKLLVYNKQYGNVRPSTAAQICYEVDGSETTYLQPGAIEDYLEFVENRWNFSVETFASPSVDATAYFEAKHVISRYLPYLRLLTPAGLRTQSAALSSLLKLEMKKLYKAGKIPPPPPGYEFLMEDIEKHIAISVDPNYAKALAATAFNNLSKRFYGYSWTRVRNTTEIPFITSDNPICYWYRDPAVVAMTYLPLSPTLGIIINPFTPMPDSEGEAKPELVKTLNSLVIKHAEKIVIANSRSTDLQREIVALRNWSYDFETIRSQIGNDEFVRNTWKVSEKKPSNEK